MREPRHGGDLERAIATYGGDGGQWIDLSSGIAPEPYPLPPVPARVWQRLPDGDAALAKAACDYYGTSRLLAAPGSQALITLLPQLRPRSRVGVIVPAYAEHRWQWHRHGHTLVELADDEAVEDAIDELDVLIVINPNNPDCRQRDRHRLLAWHARLARRQGWLIVDEAFADPDERHSLLDVEGREGLIVLRSIGKFFGLAGIRLGFINTDAELLERLRIALGPWAVSGPAHWAATLALADRDWQGQQRERLMQQSDFMAQQLTAAGLAPAGHHPLMLWCPVRDAARWQAALARQHIWTRLADAGDGLRFGPLPHALNEDFTRRLTHAAKEMNNER